MAKNYCSEPIGEQIHGMTHYNVESGCQLKGLAKLKIWEESLPRDSEGEKCSLV